MCKCNITRLSKTFDSVPHARLIAQLESYGITRKVILWITWFVNNRKQAVCVNGAVFQWAKVMSVVPQGSVLGPVIFIIYINSLPDSVTNYIKLFAADSNGHRLKPLKTTKPCRIYDITLLHEWADTWQLNFNEKKCTVRRIGKSSLSYTYTMTNHRGQTVKLEETTCE